jgi:AcrR family transcriptional regulator
VAAVTSATSERVARRGVDKFAERRSQLADAALQTLGELGYARTSLREIAQNSEFSHGVLHYYFTDKLDLITACVRQYKATCVTRYDHVVASSTTGRELREGFGATMVATMRDEAPMHRLWYDLRSQALFEPAFREDVRAIDLSLEQMVWRVLSRYSELVEVPVTVPPSVAYAALDGLFQQALLRQLSGDPTAGDHLLTGTAALLGQLVPTD